MLLTDEVSIFASNDTTLVHPGNPMTVNELPLTDQGSNGETYMGYGSCARCRCSYFMGISSFCSNMSCGHHIDAHGR